MNKPRTGKILNCFGCSKECYMPTYRLKTFKWCSRECKDKFGCTEKIIANCAICGEIFDHISSRCNKAKYCSRKCYYRSQLRFDCGTKEYTCLFCKIKFMDSPCKNRRFCSRSCASKQSLHTEFEPTEKSFRKYMKNRGRINKCEKCGYDEIKEILGVHHKDGNRANNKKENLMIVCPMCHSLIHRKHIPH